MPDMSSSSSSSVRLPFLRLLLISGERGWRLEHVKRQQQQQRLQQQHNVYQTGNAMPRLQCRLPVFRINPDGGGLIVCCVCLLVLMKAALTCSSSHASNVIPPVILNGPPPHKIYNPSDKTSLPCTAYGTLPLTYDWFKNGEKLEPNSYTAFQSDGSLTLNSQNNPVEGYYQCRVKNTAGVAISNLTFLQTAVINVTFGRDRYVVQTIVRKACQSLVLNCSHVIQSIPSATMTWVTDGDRPVNRSDRVTVAENGSLVFTYLLQSDSNYNSSAYYKCLAYNPVTKKEFGGSYYSLTVSGMEVERSEDEPELLYSSSSVVHALEGQPFQMSCLFGGVPTPSVDWVLPDGVVVNNIRQIQNQSARRSHEGNYTCRGKTLRHTKEEHFQVIIDALPRVETELKEQVAMRGSTVRFQCPAVGRPNPAVSWFVNGAPYNESLADNSLVLFDVQNSSSISCNVSNKYGYHMSSTYLLVVDDVIATTSSQDDTSAPSTKATMTTTTTTTTNVGSGGSRPSASFRRQTMKDDGSSRSSSSSSSSSSTPSNNNNSESGRHALSDVSNPSGNLWFLVALPVVAAVAGLIAFVYCRHKRRRSYSPNDHESQHGLQAMMNRDLETNGDSDDSGYDDVSRKTKQLKQAKRLSDMPEVEEASYL